MSSVGEKYAWREELEGVTPCILRLGGGWWRERKSGTVSEQIGGGQTKLNAEWRKPKHHRLPGENRGGEESDANKSRRGETIGGGPNQERHERQKYKDRANTTSLEQTGGMPKKNGQCVGGGTRSERER